MADSGSNDNIARHLPLMAQRFPNHAALTTQRDNTTLTFSQLEALSNRYASGLLELNFTRSMRVLVMLRPGPDFVTAIFALFKIGALPVLIDPGMGLRNMLACVEHIRPHGMIGLPRAELLRLLRPSAFQSAAHFVSTGRIGGLTGPTLADLRACSANCVTPAPVRTNEPAAILFTSGSTGPAKGVIYEHGMFDAQVLTLQHMGLKPGDIELATFPLFALFCPALGMTCVFPEMNFSRPGRVDPRRIVQAVCLYQTTNAFGSPALWNRVSRYCLRTGIQLPWLRRIFIAGAPVDWRVLQRVKQVISPHAEVFTPYGATEALPVASISGTEILASCLDKTRRGDGICVGRPIPDRDLRIIRITDEPLPHGSAGVEMSAGHKGEIIVSGPIVTRQYYELPQATTSAKIQDADRLWHRMGDIGYLDAQGRLWYCGRKSHRVETPTAILFTECCEALFNDHPDVARSALVGIGPRGHQKPVIIIEPSRRFATVGRAGSFLKNELLALAQRNPLTAAITTVLFHAAFPVDVRHNAKIDREKLARWAERRLR